MKKGWRLWPPVAKYSLYFTLDQRNNSLALHCLPNLETKQSCHWVSWLSGVPRRRYNTCKWSHTPFSSAKIKICLLPAKCGSLAELCGSSLSLLFISCSHLVLLQFCCVCIPLWPRHLISKNKHAQRAVRANTESFPLLCRSQSRCEGCLLSKLSHFFEQYTRLFGEHCHFAASNFSHLPTYCSKKFYSHI